MGKTRAFITPFNYFECKVDMVIHLRSKGLYWLTIKIEHEPNSVVEKAKYFNRLDEEFGMLCINTSRDFLIRVEIIGTPNEFWLNSESLFRKTFEMRVHKLENELISQSPSHYETIEYFFNNFKELLLQLKQCGIENK